MISNTVLKAKEYVSKLISPLKEKWYEFHNLDHTLSVYKRASYLAIQEWLDEEMQEIVQLAALFHDTWFVKQYDNNEPIWAEIAEKWLKEQNYPEDKIDIIKQTILATIPDDKEPESILQKIIKDADLDNLWNKSFTRCNLKLKQELESIKWLDISVNERLKNTYNFISWLKFHTQTQIKERQKTFEENKKVLKNKI